jgi:hypothetical protein
MTTKWTTNISKWKTGIGHAIAANRKRHADLEVRRVRYVLAAFLRRCAEMMRHGYETGKLLATAVDLEFGELSVVEYVEDLLVHAHDREEFARLGLPSMRLRDDEGTRVTRYDDECPNCNDRTLEDGRCVRCGYEDMPF